MQAEYDYKKYRVLYVDDEEKSLRAFTRAFGESFRVLTADNARDGLALLEQHKDEIGVMMTDQRMPGEHGTWLLERARRLQPRIIRMLVTAFTDMNAAIEAINTGAIYKYITKPWDPPMLDTNLRRALEFFMVQKERDELLQEKLSVIHNMLVADRLVSLGLLAQGLSHHIRNSLQAVKTFLDLAPAKLDAERFSWDGLRDPGFWGEYHRNAQDQLDKINRLLRDLWATQNKPDFEFADRVSVRDIAASEAAKLAGALSARNITVVNEIPDGLPEIRVDTAKFRRLFDLLLRDEMISLPNGSVIRFTGRHIPQTHSGRPEVEITLTDDGPGLPRELLRLLFDPFVVRVDAPTEYGINLMACFFIVHHHGGRIEARNAAGRGAEFILRLPLEPAIAPVADSPEFLRKALLNETLLQKILSSAE